MNLPTLVDVALGLALVFFILASIGSVLAELWAAHRKLRHRLLRDTVDRLLGSDIAQRFWDHSLILPLYEPPQKDDDDDSKDDKNEADASAPKGLALAKRYVATASSKLWERTTGTAQWLTSGRKAEAPAYLDAQLFATVVLDLASGEGALGPIPNDRASWEATIKANIAEIVGDNNDLEDHLLALLRQLPANTPDFAAALKLAVIKWYDEAMQRTSGSYRRKNQKSLLVIGAILALGLNVDAVRIAQILYLNPQLRSDVAAQATAVAQDNQNVQPQTPAAADDAKKPPQTAASGSTPKDAPGANTSANTSQDNTTAPQAAKTPRAQLRESAAQLRDLAKIGFPLGWQQPAKEGFLFLHSGELTWASWLAKVLGLFASALAVCLGAPFWFDVIGRLVKLRSSAGADAEKSKTAPGAATAAGNSNPPPAPTSPDPARNGSGGGAAPSTPPAPLPAATVALAPVIHPSYALARAYWLAEFADHAYETNETLLEAWLQQNGFELKQSFNDANTDTQGFLAVAGNIAVLAFRGTEKKFRDWQDDANVVQIADPAKVIPGALHKGFITAFNSVAAAVDQELDALKAAGATLHVTGHSLGAALATLAALHCEGRSASAGLVTSVHTYGSPRVGDPVFAAAFERSLRGRTFRFVNNEDLVTRVPPTELPLESGILHYEHVGEMKFIDAQGKVMGEVSFMFRLLNFTTNALDSVRTAVVTTLKDHSMQLYCACLRKAS